MLIVWERALREGKEVVCMMDANLNSLSWDNIEEMSSRDYEYQLKPLVEILFERIMSLGTTMMIKKATRSWQGTATKCLDHIYTSDPSKMGDPEVVWTGLSDHALVKVKRYTKSLERKPRYIRKRCYKNFSNESYKQMIKSMPELDRVLTSECPNEAAEIFTEGLTRVLDKLAPLRTIQIRNNYAPWLSENTKEITKRRREAQSKAASTGNPEDLRLVRSLRNQAVSGGRRDREAWEREKQQSRGKSPGQIWAGVRSVLGWGNSGPPSRLYHDGKYIDTPKGLATTYNNFTNSKI